MIRGPYEALIHSLLIREVCQPDNKGATLLAKDWGVQVAGWFLRWQPLWPTCTHQITLLPQLQESSELDPDTHAHSSCLEVVEKGQSLMLKPNGF